MIRNYLKTAFRNILRNRTFSLINIFGLSLSLAVCLVIIMMVADQLSMDRHIENASNIYRVNTERLHEDNGVNTFATAPLPIGKELSENYTGINRFVRIRRGFGNGWIGIEDDNSIPLGGFFVDSQFIDFFELSLEKGNPATALVEPYSVVLTQKAAIKLFGTKDPMDEVIDMGEIGDYKVTGVLKELEGKSHIIYEALASMSTTDILEKDSTYYQANENWEATTAGWVYLDIDSKKSKSEIIDHLVAIDEKQYADNDLVDYRFHLQNILNINPGPLLGNQIGPGLPMLFVYFLGGLALIVMISACFNYTNLSIAKSLNRAKEVGIRKVSGALKRQVFSQFIIEAILISMFSLVIAYLLVLVIEPAFQSLMLVNLLQWELSFSWQVILSSILFTMLIGLLAGAFPASVLSSFQPIKVLKDLSSMRLFSKMGLRKILLTSQLVLSLFFILTVLILQNQLDLMVTADKGFKSDNMINIALIKTDGETLKNELLKQSGVEGVTLTSHIPAGGISRGEYFKRNLEDERTNMNYFAVDEDYLSQMQIELLAGKNLSASVNTKNEVEILINEKAVEVFQFESIHDALGKVLYNEDSAQLIVAGVIENYHHQMMVTEIEALALRYLPDMFDYAHVELNGENLESGLEQVEQAWATVNPIKQIQYKYLTEEINEFYDFTFGDLTKVVSVFSILALSVASLGLLGMAIYTTQTRMKEVSIRKVLGASSKNIIFILSNGFFRLMTIAILIAVPMSYYINGLWLQSIAYRIDISVNILLAGTFLMILLGLITIGSQTIKAGYTNPAENLRNE